MEKVIFSAWIEHLEDRLDNFISEPSDDNESALLALMTRYREALRDENSSYAFNVET